LAEAITGPMQRIAQADPVMAVWWATELECVSALARLERERALTDAATQKAFTRLERLAAACDEGPPAAALRGGGRRLRRVRHLRTADALQLAAASILSEGQPGSLELVTLDHQLAAAARREGFSVLETDPR